MDTVKTQDVSFYPKQYFVYMLSCADGSIYTGFTVDSVQRRYEKHIAGNGSKHVAKNLPATLDWYLGGIRSKELGLLIEKRLKVFRKSEKLALIAGDQKLLARVKNWLES